MNTENTNPTQEEKGELHGNCNRTACQKPGAVYFNHSTEKYYCSACANLINAYNRIDSMRLFGHDLCIHFEKLKQKGGEA